MAVLILGYELNSYPIRKGYFPFEKHHAIIKPQSRNGHADWGVSEKHVLKIFIVIKKQRWNLSIKGYNLKKKVTENGFHLKRGKEL